MVWALDLGTTNSGIARWDSDADTPRLVELPNICRAPGRTDPLEAPRLIPSGVHVLPPKGMWSKLGRWRFFMKRVFWDRQAHIGRRALDLNQGWPSPSYAPTFKGYLGREPHRSLARIRTRQYSARDIGRIFLRELFLEVQEVTGERIRDLVVTVPVESYDIYRAEVKLAAKAVGVERLRYIDEPVAAALGYGLGVGAQRYVLVVDYGGGTLDLALVELSARGVEGGECKVLAKEGRPIGGNVVDEWLLESFAKAIDIPLEDADQGGEAELWYRLMLDEARRVKEAVYFETTATFQITPPDDVPSAQARMRDRKRFLDVTREDVVAILEHNEMYAILEDCCDGIARQLHDIGLDESRIDNVLMVGGSTLLPQVYRRFETRYGRDRVRAWQPFEAVAFGACAYAANRFVQSDFIVHDYAFVTYQHGSKDPTYTTIIPRGTRFPTRPDLWKRQLVPTCALGEPEKIFKLVICEVAGGDKSQSGFAWDADGNVHRVGSGGEAEVVVPLNEANPTLGQLSPPHRPGDRTPRLEIAFGVDENRWLCATVKDLKSGTFLMKDEPVVRLL